MTTAPAAPARRKPRRTPNRLPSSRDYFVDKATVEVASAEHRKALAMEAIAATQGPALLGWFRDGDVGRVLAELARWASDPCHWRSLPYAECCARHWGWDPHEDVTVWFRGRVVALVSRDTAGAVTVRRFPIP
jgi:hypothetical protein